MARAKKEPKKNRRRRKNKLNAEAAPKGVVANVVYAARKAVQKGPKKKRALSKSVHPNAMEIGLTPSAVDGPSKDQNWTMHGKLCVLFMVPMTVALAIGQLGSQREHVRMGTRPPFVEGEFTSSDVVYNPKSTGIEYLKAGQSKAYVRQNTSYARQQAWIDLKESTYRNYQMVYVYAHVGRELPESLTDPRNGSYQYQQFMRTNLLAYTKDALASVSLVSDYEVTRRVRCRGLNEWCRKIPVGYVSSLNFPVYQASVRFSRPPQRLGAALSWNSTIPIVGKLSFEYIPTSWLIFEFIVRCKP